MKGPTYSKAELERVFDLYPSVSGAIHERNPKIIQLATSMNRGIRSVENQLLMFRSYERQVRGEEYGRSNWNALIPEIYDERMSVMKTVNMSYPESFKQFQKSQKSAVSRLSDIIDDQSPLGRINTPLHDFLDRCLDDNSVLEKKSIIALVGGAGNGKTNSLGFVLKKLRKRHLIFNDDSQVSEAIRSSSEETGGYFATLEEGNFQFSLIQDATQPWVTQSGELLSQECSLNQALTRAFSKPAGLLIICINRGVISSLVSNSKGAVYDLLKIIRDQTSVDSYLHDRCNIHQPSNVQALDIDISSYPLDKMRLFGKSPIHKDVCLSILNHSWSDHESKGNFASSFESVGSLFSALELWRNGLVTFRDYMHFLHLLYAPLEKESWLDLAPVRLWFGSGQEPEFVKLASKVLPDSRVLSGLSTLKRFRNQNPEIGNFDHFDPLKIHQLISADDVQAFITSFRNSEVDAGEEITLGEMHLRLSQTYHQLFSDLVADDIELDRNYHDRTSDKFKLKRIIFSLIAQGLSSMIFEQEKVFFLAEELESFEKLDDKNKLVALLKASIGFSEKKSDGSISSFDYGLTNELWAYEKTPSVSEKVEVGFLPELIVNTQQFKPDMAAKILRFNNHEGKGKMTVIVDFTKYCSLIQMTDDYTLYAESYPTWFSIWINSIKAKMASESKRSGNFIKIFNVNTDVGEVEM